jgi:hypothetical protein
MLPDLITAVRARDGDLLEVSEFAEEHAGNLPVAVVR